MFGISGAEFLVILVIAILVIPVRNWPDVARFLARAVKCIRGVIWKLTDAGERIKSQIELEKPIDELIKSTTDDMLADFSSVRKSSRRSNKKSGTGRNKK